jgi:phi LC3 family holin
MKINMSVRTKNPWFWVGVVGVILTAMGVSPEMLTSWSIVWENIVKLFTNPFMLFSVALSVLGIFVDPTTQGVSDSNQAMTYTTPRKDTDVISK